MKRRRLAALAAAATAVTSAVALPTASTAEPAASSTLTVFLKAPDPAALTRLAHATNLSRSQRIAALEPLLPSAAAHRTVENQLSAQGFRVVGETSWSIAAGSIAHMVDRCVGGRPTAPPRRTALRGRGFVLIQTG